MDLLGLVLKLPKISAGEVLIKRKIGILEFLNATDLSADKVFLHYLLAACDAKDQVSTIGEHYLKKR